MLALLLSAPWVMAQEGTHWQCNIYDYQYDMTVYFNLGNDGTAIPDLTDYEVAAFVGNECRGVASVQTITTPDESQVQCGYLRIRSNLTEGETISFKVYRKSTGKTLCVKETQSFKALDINGFPSNPIQFTLSDVLLGDVNSDGEVNAVDLSMLIDRILQIENADFIEAAGDINSDGEINAVDYSLMINLILSI